MTWVEVSSHLADGAIAVLPVGAGTKQHGFHLPMATDQIQAEWFAGKLAEKIHALIWPTVTYGPYPAFAAYAGSVSLSNDSFEALLAEIATELVRFGARRVLVLNTGLSTIAPIDRALLSLTSKDRVRHFQIHSGPTYKQVALQTLQQTYGSHADEAETAIMLEIAPHLVAMTQAQASPPRDGYSRSGPLSPTDKQSATFSPSGSWGDPALATSEKGRMLVEAILSDLLEDVSRCMQQNQT